MAKGTKLIAISYISINGMPPVRFDTLTPTVRAECVSKMAENIEGVLSNYLSNHPDEALPLLKNVNK